MKHDQRVKASIGSSLIQKKFNQKKLSQKILSLKKLSLGLISLSLASSLYANDVNILAADLKHQGNNTWSLSVTLKHDDTGWDHYADNWRLVDSQGKVLGDRVLYHPHVNEQPFTRSLNGIQIPAAKLNTGETLYVEAHDKVHGWTKKRLALDLSQVKNGRLQQKR